MKTALRWFKGLAATNLQYKFLKNSGIDWAQYGDSLPFDVKDPIQHFIDNFEKHPIVIPGYFDSAYYLQMNPDVRANSANPLVHFLLYGRDEGRPAWAGEDKATDTNEKNVELRSDSVMAADPGLEFKRRLKTLLSEEGLVRPDMNPETLATWIDSLVDKSELREARIEGFFDQSLYESMYIDVAHTSINSFQHFINHGRSEGRLGWVNMTPGGLERNTTLETVLVVTHDASVTGAPVVALEVARRLTKYFNVVTASLKGGELRSSFIETSVLHLDAPAEHGVMALEYCLKQLVERTGVSTVLLNSVESVDMAYAATTLGLPTISLLHEFSEYTLPVGKMGRMILSSDIVVYAAESLKNSGLRELRATQNIQNHPSHLRVQPQGYLGFKTNSNENWTLRKHLGLIQGDVVVVGAGYVHPRKGVDWFLETCHHLRENLQARRDPRADRLQFVWLGDGYNKNDFQVGVWIDTYVQKKGLENRVHFPGAVHDVGAALIDADLFLLTSRLDPFPNVAVDALNADCGIGVFEEASGMADFLQENTARAVYGKYGDPRDLAEKLAKNFDEITTKDGRNTKICQENLNFDRYVDTLTDFMDEAASRRRDIDRVLRQESSARFLDAEFYSGVALTPDKRQATHFLNLLRKGIAVAKPFPGSDIQAMLDEVPLETNDFDILIDKAMSTKVDSMPVHYLTGAGEDSAYKGRIAIQLHVFYAELIPEFCRYFRNMSDHNIDLFVTHVPELTSQHIEELAHAVTGDLHLERIENRGRDVYAFHHQFTKDIYGHYDIVGHFHTKKSKHALEGLGDRWRQYLLHNLIGSRETSKEIFSLFQNKDIGLVFPEDHHLVDEGENAPYIEKLLTACGLRRNAHYRHFPIGTMFWARTDALVALLKWPNNTFKLVEPIPIDGSVLHAFERILPQLTNEAGFKIARVYKPGTHW